MTSGSTIWWPTSWQSSPERPQTFSSIPDGRTEAPPSYEHLARRVRGWIGAPVHPAHDPICVHALPDGVHVGSARSVQAGESPLSLPRATKVVHGDASSATRRGSHPVHDRACGGRKLSETPAGGRR